MELEIEIPFYWVGVIETWNLKLNERFHGVGVIETWNLEFKYEETFLIIEFENFWSDKNGLEIWNWLNGIIWNLIGRGNWVVKSLMWL